METNGKFCNQFVINRFASDISTDKKNEKETDKQKYHRDA